MWKFEKICMLELHMSAFAYEENRGMTTENAILMNQSHVLEPAMAVSHHYA